ncbi:uncharacterized protein LOC111116244 isoform X2 [Crassostrea virginica]
MWLPDQTMFDYTNWAPGESDNLYNRQHCVLMDSTRSYHWIDEDCEQTAILFVNLKRDFLIAFGKVVTYTQSRSPTPLTIQPSYAYTFTSTNQFRIRRPRDTSLLFGNNGDLSLKKASVSGSRCEFDGNVPFTQNAVAFKSDSSAEEMMITLANQDNDDDAKSGITQFKETALDVGIDRIVEGTITTYQT